MTFATYLDNNLMFGYFLVFCEPHQMKNREFCLEREKVKILFPLKKGFIFLFTYFQVKLS